MSLEFFAFMVMTTGIDGYLSEAGNLKILEV